MQYRVIASFTGKVDRYGDSTESNISWYLSADDEWNAIDAVMKDIKEGEYPILKGLAVTKLENTVIL